VETSVNKSFKIKTGNFEGPFGLLLDLVEKRKLFINDVSLALVTEDYLKYMKGLGEEGSRLEEISSFVVVAATLILIKSKSLLPGLELSTEEESNISSLEERLRLYEQFRLLGNNIRSNFGKKIIFAPEERKMDILIFLPDERITGKEMMTLAQGVLQAMPTKEKLPEVPLRKVVTIEEMIGRLTERIEKAMELSFKNFVPRGANRAEKIEVIVGFLAMLELVRQGILEARQENDFEDIMITKNNGSR